MIVKSQRSLWVMLACLTFSGMCASLAAADENDPPIRVARLAYVEGSVSFQPAGTGEWVEPPINRPVTTGDQLWSDRESRAELQLDGSSVRLSANTAVSLLNLSDTVTQIQLSSGTLLLRVRRLDDNETYEIDTPNLAFSVLRPGLYRISVDGTGNSTTVLVRRGQGEVTGGGVAYPVGENEYDTFSGNDELRETAQSYTPDQDAFDAWGAARDARWEHSVSAQYVSPDVVGYEDLDDQGSWTADPEYGHVWFPRAVQPGWAPYRTGHWAYIAPWGYTWVDDSSWGFAPFHYGRWVSLRGAWGWIPAPPRLQGAVYVRPVYAPALVAWVGVGAGVAWFALGPREVYVPSYAVSARYCRNINVSNTNVNVAVVNNVYNTTIINKRTVNNITYVNRTVPGAVVATTSRAFDSAQPVGRNLVRVDEHTARNGSVRMFAPATVPTRQAVIGSGRETTLRPPAVVQTRPVVARTEPPRAPPNFERRQEAIKDNGGKPLSVSQIRQISESAPAAAAVRLAPPPRMVVPRAEPPAERSAPANAARPPERPAPVASDRPNSDRAPRATSPPPPVVQSVPNAIHPRELPRPSAAPSPAIANSVLERQHLQEQQQQQATQNAERQRLQQQQEAEHQQAARQAADQERQRQAQTQQLAQRQQQEAERQQAAQQTADQERQRQAQTQQLAQRQQQEVAQQQAARQAADQARQQELERQHQAQTQQLAQRHAEELQQLQNRQQEQRRQQQASPPPNPRKQDNEPQRKP
jgi:DNA segregation ATPase FtsK/SpoIIIE-like protein